METAKLSQTLRTSYCFLL